MLEYFQPQLELLGILSLNCWVVKVRQQKCVHEIALFLFAVVSVHFISCAMFFTRMYGINVLLPGGIVINERTPRYFAVCLFLRVWPSHSTHRSSIFSWKRGMGFFQHSPYADSAGNKWTAVWKLIVSFLICLPSLSVEIGHGNICNSWISQVLKQLAGCSWRQCPPQGTKSSIATMQVVPLFVMFTFAHTIHVNVSNIQKFHDWQLYHNTMRFFQSTVVEKVCHTR